MECSETPFIPEIDLARVERERYRYTILPPVEITCQQLYNNHKKRALNRLTLRLGLGTFFKVHSLLLCETSSSSKACAMNLKLEEEEKQQLMD